jgi:hypothetical protein
MAEGMDDVWMSSTRATGQPTRLHGLWLAAERPGAPVLLYLHGARWNVTGSAMRIRRMQELGFSVLAIDYRGFGKSSAGPAQRSMAAEDARAAWDWLASSTPRRRATSSAIRWAAPSPSTWPPRSRDERGVMVEGTFTSIPDVASTMKWGWLPWAR